MSHETKQSAVDKEEPISKQLLACTLCAAPRGRKVSRGKDAAANVAKRRWKRS